MNCPKCGKTKMRVICTVDEGGLTRRWRRCSEGHVCTTEETVIVKNAPSATVVPTPPLVIDAAILELLREKDMSAADLCRALGVRHETMYMALLNLEARNLVYVHTRCLGTKKQKRLDAHWCLTFDHQPA